MIARKAAAASLARQIPGHLCCGDQVFRRIRMLFVLAWRLQYCGHGPAASPIPQEYTGPSTSGSMGASRGIPRLADDRDPFGHYPATVDAGTIGAHRSVTGFGHLLNSAGRSVYWPTAPGDSCCSRLACCKRPSCQRRYAVDAGNRLDKVRQIMWRTKEHSGPVTLECEVKGAELPRSLPPGMHES